MRKIYNLASQIDLFATPFSFFIRDKKNTFIGGLLSVSIIVISVIYFSYLMNLYFTNQIEPKITSTLLMETQRQEIIITENFFMFEMFIGGIPLKQYEKNEGKLFLTYRVNFQKYHSDGSFTFSSLPISNCQENEFTDFFCLDDSYLQQNSFYIEALLRLSSAYSIVISQCDSKLFSNCAQTQQIHSLINSPNNYLIIYTKIQQYSPTQKAYKYSYKQEYFLLDSSQFIFARMSLIKSITQVKQGYIIQNQEVKETIFDQYRRDTFFSKDKTGENNEIIQILYEMNQSTNLIVVQHAMITEMLAQFISIFNSLLIIGIIVRVLAQTNILEDMNNLLLKEYYKRTALQLVDDGKESLEKKLKTILYEQKAMKDNEQTEEIINLKNMLNQQNFASYQQNHFKMGIFQRISIIFKQLIAGHKSKKNGEKETEIYKKLLDQSMKKINIFEIYKDILKLKMAVKLMLTKQQFAAIQFCGSEIQIDSHPFKENNLSYNLNYTQQEQNENLMRQSNKRQQQKSVSNYSQQTPSPIQIQQIIHKNVQLIKSGEGIFSKKKYDKLKLEEFMQTSKEKKSILEGSRRNEEKQEDRFLRNNYKSEISLSNFYYKTSKEANELSEESQISTLREGQPKIFSHYSSQQSKINKGDQEQISEITFNDDDNSLKGNRLDIKSQSIEDPSYGQLKNSFSIQEFEYEKQISNSQIVSTLQQQFENSKKIPHLIFMDIIEENEEVQLSFLKLFLNDFKKQDNTNQIDQQIYQSLIQQNHKNHIHNHTNISQKLKE